MRTTTIDAALASELRIAVMRLARRLRQQRADERLSSSQLSVLATLERHGTLSLGDLAAHEHVQPPSMTRSVASLEELGLVARTASPRDGRQVLLSVTPAGAKVLAGERRRRDAWLCRQMKQLTPEEIETLRAAVAVIDRLGERPA